MKYYLICLLMFLPFPHRVNAQQNNEGKDILKELKGLFEKKPFVHGTAVYEIYDMKLSDCRLEYNIYITDQDEREGKIYIHRNYSVQLSQLNEAVFREVDSSFYWVTLSAKNGGGVITESILPDKKSKMIPLPISKKLLSFTGLPVYTNKPKYIIAINRLIHFCAGAETKPE